MELTLQRYPTKNGCTIGQLFVDGVFECYTCEDEVREILGQPVESWKIYGKTAIGVGRYRVEITVSDRFKRLLPILLRVLGFKGIRIHIGNKAEDTDGCILVGRGRTPTGVTESTLALEALLSKLEKALQDGGEVWITILNSPEVTT